MRKIYAMFLGLAIMLPLSISQADETPFVLDKKVVAQMTPAAARLCRQAERRLDRIDYIGALNLYVKAQEAEPENVELRFIVGDLAIREAQKRTGHESLELLEKARRAYQEILDLKTQGHSIRRPEMRRSANALKQVENLIATQEKRDQDRNRIGKAIIENYVRETTVVPTSETAGTSGGPRVQGQGAAGGLGGGRGRGMQGGSLDVVGVSSFRVNQ